ncbi:MAG: response regulator transcription factor [Panacagrimonas sp.]
MLNVLVLDGDDAYRRNLCLRLVGVGIKAFGIRSSASLDEALSKGPFDVVLCSIELPGENGFAVSKRLRRVSGAGLILLAASEKREDRIMALSMGADHYLVKPKDFRELEMNIRNLHALMGGETDRKAVGSSRPDTWVFDAAHWTLSTPEGRTVSLSLAEHQVLNCLFKRCGEVVSRTDLLTGLDRGEGRACSRNLDMIISRLRRKVSLATRKRLPILSARGVGYVFSGPASLQNEPVSFL